MASHPVVLIVEDEPLVMDVLREMLESEYRVSCAKTAEEAFALLRTTHVDVALVDSVLPDGRGDEVAACAEKLAVPVIAMSGHPREFDKVERRNVPYLLKPFGANLLLSAVAAVLQAPHRGAVSG